MPKPNTVNVLVCMRDLMKDDKYNRFLNFTYLIIIIDNSS